MKKPSITNKITPCCKLPFSVMYWWISNLTLNTEADRMYIINHLTHGGSISNDAWKVLINSGTLEDDAALSKPEFLAWFNCGRQPDCDQLPLIIEGYKLGNWTPETELPPNIALIDMDNLVGNVFTKQQSMTLFSTKVNNVEELRAMKGVPGQGVTLLGYYTSGDKQPVNYIFKTGSYTDDGGSIIASNGGFWIAQFNDRINALDFGVKADYDPISKTGTDNSDFIEKMFAVKVSVYELPVGDILLDRHLKIPNGVLIKGSGAYRTKIYRGTSTGSSTGVLYQLSASDAEILEGSIISDVSFWGQVNETNHNQWTHLASVAGTRNAKYIRCHFWGFRGDGILVSSGPANGDRRRNINVKIEDCYFNGLVSNNRNGVSVIMADDITIQNNFFENIGAPTLSQSVGAIDVERNSITTQVTGNVRILNNIFKDISTTNTAGIALFCFGDNIEGGIPSSKNHEIRGNRFINCYWGISVPEAKLDMSNNVTPTGLNIDSNFFIQNVKAIQLNANSNVSIKNNHFYGNNANGKFSNIELWSIYVVKNLSIKDNFFYNTGRNASIDITSADGLEISGNVCASNRPFIQQSVDSVSGGTARVLNNIEIFRNSFEGLGSTSLRMYQVATGANNAKLIMNNSSCKMYDNKVTGNAVLSNLVTSVFNNIVLDSHVTAAMLTGTWKTGDFVETKINNYNYRVKCSVSGTTTFTDTINAVATNGSNLLEVTSAINTQLRKGMFILIGDDAAVKEITDVYGDTVVLKTVYGGTSNVAASVLASPPIFISEPITNYVRTVSANTNTNLGKGEETLIFTGGGVGASVITTDVNGFPNAIKRFRNNKSGILTVSGNAGVSLNGVDAGSVLVDPGKTLTIILTAVNTWVTLDYVGNATATLQGTVKKSAALAVSSVADATDLTTVIALANDLKIKINTKLTNDKNAEQQL